MTEQIPVDPPAVPPSWQPPQPYYGPPPGYYQPVPPRTHAEMNWQDLSAFLISIVSFGFLTPLALIFGLISFEEAKKAKLKQHAIGMVGLILAIIGSSFWALFIVLAMIGAASR